MPLPKWASNVNATTWRPMPQRTEDLRVPDQCIDGRCFIHGCETTRLWNISRFVCRGLIKYQGRESRCAHQLTFANSLGTWTAKIEKGGSNVSAHVLPANLNG